MRKFAAALLCAASLTLSSSALMPAGNALRAAEIPATDNWIYLDGSQSSDDYGARLQYQWRQTGGAAVRLENAASARPRFLPPAPGLYTFELVVSNGDAASKPAVVNIQVDPANTAPVAALPPTISLTLGENLVLDGSRSQDADGDPLTYQWRQVAGTALLSEVAAKQSQHASQLTLKPASAGIYEFELSVSDGRETSAPQRCRVEVVRPISVPVARVSAPHKAIVKFTRPAPAQTAPAPATPAPAKPASVPAAPQADDFADLHAMAAPIANNGAPALPVARIAPVAVPAARKITVSEPAVPALTIEEMSDEDDAPLPAIDVLAAAAELPELNTLPAAPKNAPAAAAPISPVREPRLRVTPAAAPEAPQRPQIKMMPINRPDTARLAGADEKVSGADWTEVNVAPVAAVKGNITAETGQRVLLEGVGTDVDGDAVTYRWRQTAGPVIPGTPEPKKNIAFIPQEAGVYIFELVVNDGKEDSEPAACAVTVIDAELENVAPAPAAAAATAAPENTPSADAGNTLKKKIKFWK